MRTYFETNLCLSWALTLIAPSMENSPMWSKYIWETLIPVSIQEFLKATKRLIKGYVTLRQFKIASTIFQNLFKIPLTVLNWFGNNWMWATDIVVLVGAVLVYNELHAEY